MKIKAFIVDDEALARDELKYLLTQVTEVEVIGEAEDGLEAIEKMNNLRPDVVFLDIQMPNLDGITVAKKFVGELRYSTLIVFATAYDEHAIKAFEMNAVDYLLKPFDEDRVRITVDRIKERLKKQDNEHERLTEFLSHIIRKKEGTYENKTASKLAVSDGDSIILLDPNDIIYAYREGRDVLIKAKGGSYITKYTLQVLEEKLRNYPFFRTHRSYLVNLNYIQGMIPWFNGAYNLLLKDIKDVKIPVSRQYVKPLRDELEL